MAGYAHMITGFTEIGTTPVLLFPAPTRSARNVKEVYVTPDADVYVSENAAVAPLAVVKSEKWRAQRAELAQAEAALEVQRGELLVACKTEGFKAWDTEPGLMQLIGISFVEAPGALERQQAALTRETMKWDALKKALPVVGDRLPAGVRSLVPVRNPLYVVAACATVATWSVFYDG